MIYKSFNTRCDEVGCRQMMLDSKGILPARRRLKAEGWAIVNKHWTYCPEHARLHDPDHVAPDYSAPIGPSHATTDKTVA